MLAAVRQQGLGVGGFAQTFWTLAVGLELWDSELNKVFNECLDNPLPLCEMEGLKALDYWGFIDYLCYRSLVVTPGQSVPIAVPPEMPKSATAPRENSESSRSLTRKRRSRRWRTAKSAPVVPSLVVLEDPTMVVPSLVVLEDPTLVVPSPVVLEDLTPVVPSPVVLEDPTPVVLSPVVLEDSCGP